jgi:PhzF family phenazine biosynthesis protein
MRALMQLPPRVGADGFFVFALQPGTTPLATESRMFCPVIGVPEDPVSGNAHAMLGVYLVHHGLLASNGHPARLVGHQGRFVERPGVVEVQVEAAGKRATAVQVTGDATIVYQAALEL